jgi:SAM-dependent methyltransferase
VADPRAETGPQGLRRLSRVYDTLADVYDWLVPEALLEPEGSVAAFETVVAELPAGARVLDCACGTGTLAVGLALRGFEVTASDASEGMVARTRALAARHGAQVEARARVWEELDGGPFDAVFCVGNSITHARDRRAALTAMGGVLREDGVLALTSRTWERAQEDGEEVVERHGRRARVAHTWHPGELEVAVTFEDDGTTHAERLRYRPFTHGELQDDLLYAGFTPAATTFDPEVGRYLVTSRANSSNASR